jgi:hypothetical protein
MKIVVCTIVAAVISQSAAAQSSQVTFDGPVQVGATVLAAGTYTFRGFGQHSLQVADERGKAITVVGVSPISRAASGGGVVTLRESVDGQPPRVAAWYPADGRTGVAVHYKFSPAVAPAGGLK